MLAGGIPPGAAVQPVKDGGAKLICFAPALVLAKRLVRSGADAIVIEGSEAGGHIGPVSLTVLAQEILPHMRDVPVFVAGGLGRGEAILALLEMGASGAQLGTRFAAATESIAHPTVQAGLHPRRRPRRAAVGAARRAFPGHPGARPGQRRGQDASCASRRRPAIASRPGELTKEAAQLAIEHFWAGALRRAVIDGDVENGSVMAGQSVGMVTAEQPTADIIAELVAQAVAALVARRRGRVARMAGPRRLLSKLREMMAHGSAPLPELVRLVAVRTRERGVLGLRRAAR